MFSRLNRRHLTPLLVAAVVSAVVHPVSAATSEGVTLSESGDTPSTEVLRAALLGKNEVAADLWVQLHSLVHYSRWSEAAGHIHALTSLQPEVMIQKDPGAPLYWPARRVLASWIADNSVLADAYRTQFDPLAESMLTAFEKTRDPQMLERLLAEYPYSSHRGEALRILADIRLDRADYAGAAEAFALLQRTEKPKSQSEAATWACKEAWALAREDETDRARRRIELIRERFANDQIPGVSSAGEFANELNRELGAPKPPDPAPSPDRLAADRGWTFQFDSRPIESAFRRRHAPFLPRFAPACENGIAYATNGNECRAIEIETGREAWTWRPARPGRYNLRDSLRWLEQIPPITIRPALTSDRVLFLRPIQLSEALFSICCLNRKTGELIWQRVAWSDEPERLEMSPIVAGNHAYAVVSIIESAPPPPRRVVTRRAVVCFRVDTSELVWRKELPIAGPPIDRDVPGSISEPIVSESHILVVTDTGFAYCLDRPTGAIQWMHCIDSPPPNAVDRPGLARCTVDTHRAFIALAGTREIRCVSLADGNQIWSAKTKTPVDSVGLVGDRVIAIGATTQAFSLEDGSDRWKTDLGETPTDSGYLKADRVFIPMPNGLQILTAQAGQSVARLDWPAKEPLATLVADNGHLIGVTQDDAFRKFGKVDSSPKSTNPKLVLTPHETAALFFPGVQIETPAGKDLTLPTVGQPLDENPMIWVVLDREAKRLRCISAELRENSKWEVPVAGEPRSIEFDNAYIYLWMKDRLEIRDLVDGKLLWTKESPATGKPVFTDGRAIWPHSDGAPAGEKTVVDGYRVDNKQAFSAPVEKFGVKALRAWHWEGDQIYLLGDKENGQRIFVTALVKNNEIERQGNERTADYRIQSIDFGRAPWVTYRGRIVTYAHETQDIYCYNFNNGGRAWKIVGPDKPLVSLHRLGRRLIYVYEGQEGPEETQVYIADLNDGARSIERRIFGTQATILNGKAVTLLGPYVQVFQMNVPGTHKGEIRYPARTRRPVWIQPLGNRLVVALADEKGRIREAEIVDIEKLATSSGAGRDGRSVYVDIPYYQGSIEIDGRDTEWARSGESNWEQVTEWHPVLATGNKPESDENPDQNLSAAWRACASEDALYLIVRVQDDKIVPEQLGDCPWLGDSIEIALLGDLAAAEIPTFTLSPGGVEQNWAAGPALPDGMVAQRYDPIEQRQVYEIQFPWDWLKEHGIEKSGDRYSLVRVYFAIAVNDNDGDGLRGSLEWGRGLVDALDPADWRYLRFRTGER